jgi:hypothetical protein
MKEITIFQKDNPPIRFTDDDSNAVAEYTQQMSSLLEVNNVTILETSSGSIIIRPHTISSIEVRELIEEDLAPMMKQEIKSEEPDQIITEDVITDFITDGE